MEWKWWARRKAAERRRQHQRGFLYAAGELLSGTPPEFLLANVQSAKDFHEFSEFDDGVLYALKRWEER